MYKWNTADNLPKEAGQYLLAFFFDEEWTYDVADFYPEGDNIFLNTKPEYMPEEMKTASAEERILYAIKEDVVKCPKAGFYETDKKGGYWEVTAHKYWRKITPPTVPSIK